MSAMTMTANDLARLVAKMREAQRRYFQTRTPGAMRESIRLEAQVDAMVAQILGPPMLPFESDEPRGPGERTG